MRLVPIYVRTPDGDQLWQKRPASEVETMANVTLRRRKGVIKRAYLAAESIQLIHLERDGYCIKQTLVCGWVYTLSGTPGSE